MPFSSPYLVFRSWSFIGPTLLYFLVVHNVFKFGLPFLSRLNLFLPTLIKNLNAAPDWRKALRRRDFSSPLVITLLTYFTSTHFAYPFTHDRPDLIWPTLIKNPNTAPDRRKRPWGDVIFHPPLYSLLSCSLHFWILPISSETVDII